MAVYDDRESYEIEHESGIKLWVAHRNLSVAEDEDYRWLGGVYGSLLVKGDTAGGVYPEGTRQQLVYYTHDVGYIGTYAQKRRAMWEAQKLLSIGFNHMAGQLRGGFDMRGKDPELLDNLERWMAELRPNAFGSSRTFLPSLDPKRWTAPASTE